MKIWKTLASLDNLSSKFYFTNFHLLKATYFQINFLYKFIIFFDSMSMRQETGVYGPVVFITDFYYVKCRKLFQRRP